MNRLGAIASVAPLLLISALGCGDDPTTAPEPRYSDRSDSTFVVMDSSVLEVENFAGRLTVVPGDPGAVRVEVEKWAGRAGDLDQITVELVQLQNGVRVATGNPADLDRVSVDLEITVPPDARPALRNVAGDTRYVGRAEGECLFVTSAGNITLELPADVNVEVDLSVAAGSISVDFPVDGQVSEHAVVGTIGTGADGTIEALVAAGTIVVIPQ